MIHALILDFDGLIVDTETPAFMSWQLIYADYDQVLSLDQWQGALGTNHGFDAMAHLLELIKQRDPARAAELLPQVPAILARRQQIKTDLSRDQPLLPGVLSLLAEAAEAGMPCAVASSSSRGWVEGWLARHHILQRFALTRTADDVQRTKPDPELFLSAAAGLGFAPANCLVFEDSPNGILAAQAAGMPCVAVPGAITSQLLLPPTNLRLPSLDAMPLAEIVRRCAGNY
jgi:HAD superfamily hydrolase (TIGR01509 family)